MLYQLVGIHAAFRRIEQGAAEFSNCETLPSHANRRQTPVARSGNAGIRLVRRLMARAAMQTSGAAIVRPSRDIHRVTMMVVALLRIGLSCMAVHATRVLQDWRHLLE
jgi:hypothetical protein